MADNLLDQLRDLALRIQIEPKQGIGRAATVDSVITVLSNLNKSYVNYLKVALEKQGITNDTTDVATLDKLLLEHMKLRIVDLNFGSFEASVAPPIVAEPAPLFAESVSAFERDTFREFKTLVGENFTDSRVLTSVSERFDERERASIFRPLFKVPGSGYRVNLKDRSDKVYRTIVRPSKEKMRFYVPKLTQPEVAEPTGKTVRAYIQLAGDDERLTAKNIVKVHHLAEVDPATIPITFKEMTFDSFYVEFHSPLIGEVTLDEQQYFVTNDDLDITVWGDSRTEAEDAFRFAIFALYRNFYFEQDESKLSPGARELKAHLFRITKTTNFDAG